MEGVLSPGGPVRSFLQDEPSVRQVRKWKIQLFYLQNFQVNHHLHDKNPKFNIAYSSKCNYNICTESDSDISLIRRQGGPPLAGKQTNRKRGIMSLKPAEQRN